MRLNLLERPKVRVTGYAAHLLEPERAVVIYTDREVLVARNHPEYPKWYVTPYGRFFHLTERGLHEAKVKFPPSCAVGRPNMHSAYPYICPLKGNRYDCHRFIWEAYKGRRRKGMEIDHINGNKFDWRLSNLEEVSPAENRKRAQILREMRRCGNEPCNLTSAELKRIFDSIRVKEIEN